MKPFFSVIVPAHNSGEYIGKCLRSIKKQTFRDFELIVVCDACKDDTEQIARIYTDKVIITDYGMDGLARNAGIDAAEGEWILFLDDDDWWIHEYVLQEIYDVVAGNFGEVFDMVCFDFIWKGRGYASVQPGNMNIAVWSKAFKRSLIGDTRFTAIPFTSDKPFMDEICKKRPMCYPMNKLMYYYNYMREGSQTEINARPDGAVPEA
jgi:glycosyltransferase involved in cell wall biosynthesis